MMTSREMSEAALVGAFLQGRGLDVIAGLSASDFSDAKAASVWIACRDVFMAGHTVDPVIVLARLGDDYDEYLADCVGLAAGEPKAYAEQIRAAAKLDAARLLGTELRGADSLETVEDALRRLNGLNAREADRQAIGIAQACQLFLDRHERPEKREYLRWGFDCLDSHLYTEAGDFVIVGGMPSSGKTMLALQFAATMAETKRVGFFTLETSPEKLTDRLIAQLSRVPLPRIKQNSLTDADWLAIGKTCHRLSDGLSLDIVPAAGMSAEEIEACSLARRYEVILVDYLQIVRGTAGRSRYEQVTEISVALHTMAQRHGITVIALAQLSRPDKQQKKQTPPSMTDLRESGQIEQDADAILLLYHEDPNNNRSDRLLKIGKNKEGERGRWKLIFDGATQRFMEPAGAPDLDREQGPQLPRHAHNTVRRDREQPTQVSFEDVTENEAAEPLPF